MSVMDRIESLKAAVQDKFRNTKRYNLPYESFSYTGLHEDAIGSVNVKANTWYQTFADFSDHPMLIQALSLPSEAREYFDGATSDGRDIKILDNCSLTPKRLTLTNVEFATNGSHRFIPTNYAFENGLYIPWDCNNLITKNTWIRDDSHIEYWTGSPDTSMYSPAKIYTDVGRMQQSPQYFDRLYLDMDTFYQYIDALKDVSNRGVEYQIILGEANFNRVSEEYKTIALNKGWTLSI